MDYTAENIEKLDEVSAHLFHRVSHTTICKWLNENFEEKDQHDALQLLGYFNFFTSDRIYASLKKSLEKLLLDTPTGRICIIGVRNIKKESEGIWGGQSGHMISYYAQKVAPLVSKKRIKTIRETELEKIFQTHPQRQYTIALIDDIFGSGDTVIDFFKMVRKKISPNWKVVALSVTYMPEAQRRLRSKGIDVYGEPIISIFHAIRNAGLIDSKNEPKYKKLSVKYGRTLFRPKEGLIKTLGYKSSQAFVGFEYGVPNNTLPIIWASEKESGTGKNWYPIFARNIEDRLDIRRRDNIDKKKWFFMASKNGLHLKDRNNEDIGWGDALLIYMILSMINENKDEILITNALAISKHTYEECIANARRSQLLDKTNMLTEKAKMALSEINALNRKQGGIDCTTLNTTLYMPND